MLKLFLFIFSILFLFFSSAILLFLSLFTINFDSLSTEILSGPSWSFFMGTDALGRSYFPRVLIGFRNSLLFSLGSLFVIGILGAMVGAVLPFLSRRISFFFFKIIEFLDTFPSLFLILILKMILDSYFKELSAQPLWGVFFALVLTKWMILARLTRVKVEKILNEPYMEAQKSLGASRWHLFWYGIRPNIQFYFFIFCLGRIAELIFFESFLSFMGIGFQPPYIGLGSLLREGWSLFYDYPHLLFFPGLLLFLFSFSAQVMIDHLKK